MGKRLPNEPKPDGVRKWMYNKTVDYYKNMKKKKKKSSKERLKRAL